MPKTPKTAETGPPAVYVNISHDSLGFFDKIAKDDNSSSFLEVAKRGPANAFGILVSGLEKLHFGENNSLKEASGISIIWGDDAADQAKQKSTAAERLKEEYIIKRRKVVVEIVKETSLLGRLLPKKFRHGPPNEIIDID